MTVSGTSLVYLNVSNLTAMQHSALSKYDRKEMDRVPAAHGPSRRA